MDISIKTLENNLDQINNVQKFLFSQIKKEFGYDYVPEFHMDIKNLNEYYISPQRNNFYIATNENDEIIATIGLRAYDKNFNEFKGKYSKETTSSIWRLFVDEKYRRCGIASMLFRIVERFSCENNYNKIYLHTHKTLPGAIDFWKKMGFNIKIDTNNELQTVHMDKAILNQKINYSLVSTSIQNHNNYVILI